MFWWVLQAVANESILWYSAGAHALQELLLGCLPRMLSPFVGVSGHVSSTVIPIPSWKGLMRVLGRGCLNPSLVYLNFIFFSRTCKRVVHHFIKEEKRIYGEKSPQTKHTHKPTAHTRDDLVTRCLWWAKVTIAAMSATFCHGVSCERGGEEHWGKGEEHQGIKEAEVGSVKQQTYGDARKAGTMGVVLLVWTGVELFWEVRLFVDLDHLWPCSQSCLGCITSSCMIDISYYVHR
jgi:hypothetical protein